MRNMNVCLCKFWRLDEHCLNYESVTCKFRLFSSWMCIFELQSPLRLVFELKASISISCRNYPFDQHSSTHSGKPPFQSRWGVVIGSKEFRNRPTQSARHLASWPTSCIAFKVGTPIPVTLSRLVYLWISSL